MRVIELEYLLIYDLNGKEESYTTAVEKGKLPFIQVGYGIEPMTKKQYEKYNSLKEAMR